MAIIDEGQQSEISSPERNALSKVTMSRTQIDSSPISPPASPDNFRSFAAGQPRAFGIVLERLGGDDLSPDIANKIEEAPSISRVETESDK